MNYCDRIEVVQCELTGPRMPRPIAVVAATRSVIEFRVRYEGALADCAGAAATLFVSNSEGQALRLPQSYAKRGTIAFTVSPDIMTTPGSFMWQLVVEAGGVSTEWARGQFVVLDNPAADYVPIVWPAPPWLQKTDLPAYVTAGNNVTIDTDPVTGALKINATGGEGGGISPDIARNLKTALNAARTTTDTINALIAFAESFIPQESN